MPKSNKPRKPVRAKSSEVDATALLLQQARNQGLTHLGRPASLPAREAVRSQDPAPGPVAVVGVLDAAPPPSGHPTDREPADLPARDVGEDPEEGPLLYGLMATYWLTVPDRPGASPTKIRFIGRRDGAAPSAPPDFDREMPVPALPLGAGRVALSMRVVGLPQGTWHVQGEPVGPLSSSSDVQVQEQTITSRLYPLIRAPGVRPFAWLLLVLLGVVLALTVQALLVRRGGGDVGTAVGIGIASTGVGYLSAKAYYMVQHRMGLRQFVQAGTCIQGFLIGAFATLALLALAADVPVARLIDQTAPGVLFAMALARPGCWLGGCCAGRPTSSAFGLWSSDRVVGVRRLPVQLYEAALALAAAMFALGLLLAGLDQPSGAVTAAAVAAYTLGRQLLFPLRNEPRRTSVGRRAALVLSVLVLLGSVAALLIG